MPDCLYCDLLTLQYTSKDSTHTPRVALVYFNAGGGHRAAALALKAELTQRHPDWHVSLVDLFEVLDPKQYFERLTGFAPHAYYNKRLSTGFTLGLAQELKILQAMIRMSHPQLVRRLVTYWQTSKPSLVVSLVPNFNRAIGTSLRCLPETLGFSASETPFVTVMTDMADHPPNFWVEPGYTQHLVCGTARAVSQARLQGMSRQSIYQTSGMVLSPRFYDKTGVDRSKARRDLGFAPDCPIGLVMFGGHGSAAMKRIATVLADQPLILMCGRNERLRRALLALPTRAPRHVVGFTDDVASLMHLADYFIGKPGPGSISEAIHCGLPVIVMRNAWTMPQERWNTDWVRQMNVGRVVPSVPQMRLAVDDLIANLSDLQTNVRQQRNRALFEVCDIIEKIQSEQAGRTQERAFEPVGREPAL